MSRPVWVLLGMALWVGALGCQREPKVATAVPRVAFGTGEVEIISAADTFVLQVEIAETPQQQRAGLSRRLDLPEDKGMIFLFEREQPRGRGFWMYRTYVPLSIAFLDAEGWIRGLRDMEPCASWLSLLCRSYAAGVPYHAALEVKRGYFERRGIGVGDRVTLRRDQHGFPGARGKHQLPLQERDRYSATVGRRAFTSQGDRR